MHREKPRTPHGAMDSMNAPLRMLSECAATDSREPVPTYQASPAYPPPFVCPLFPWVPEDCMAMNPDSRPHTASYLGPQHHGPSLPPITSLTSELPPPGELSPGLLRRQQEEARDSGNWTLASQSKHSSAVSNTSAGLQLHSILNAEDSPTRNSIPETPYSARGSLQTNLPPIQQGFEHHRSSVNNNDVHSHRESSRRSSIDSRMNMGLNHLHITPSSPYESQNTSRVSLASNLQQARMPNGIPSPMSPTSSRMRLQSNTPRRAPVIASNTRAVSGMPDPRAPEPTKGFAWAFPDTGPGEERRGSHSSDSSDVRAEISRQNSVAHSITSSIFTTDSVLPPGQKRFDDEVHTHHHSLQHRSVASLQATEGGAVAGGVGSYSRTPELRVSHKMAERKRRSEMKGLFDELNSILPNSPGGKSSKWEILTKAIEHIKNLKTCDMVMRREADRMKMEVDMSRRHQEEVRLLQSECSHMWADLQRLDPSRAHIYGSFTNQLAHEQSRQPQANGGPGILPPPVQQAPTNNSWGASSGAMQGVEYAGPGAPTFDRR